MSIFERVKYIRKEKHLTQDEFAKRLGLTRGAITNIELEKVEPKENLLDLICQQYGVNKNWLYTGEGEPFIIHKESEKIDAFIASLTADEEDGFKTRMISMLADLTPDEWKLLEKMAERIVKEKEGGA